MCPVLESKTKYEFMSPARDVSRCHTLRFLVQNRQICTLCYNILLIVTTDYHLLDCTVYDIKRSALNQMF